MRCSYCGMAIPGGRICPYCRSEFPTIYGYKEILRRREQEKEEQRWKEQQAMQERHHKEMMRASSGSSSNEGETLLESVIGFVMLCIFISCWKSCDSDSPSEPDVSAPEVYESASSTTDTQTEAFDNATYSEHSSNDDVESEDVSEEIVEMYNVEEDDMVEVDDNGNTIEEPVRLEDL